MSVVVQHQAVEVVKAAEAVDQAQEKLEQAKRDYKNYERNVDQLEEQLKQLESDYANKVPGVQYDDLLELRELVGDAKDDKEFYQTGIALAAVNLTSSVTALAQQTAAAAASVGTWGFNAGVQLDIDATKTNATEKSSTARGSNISGNKIVIQTGTVDANGKLNTEGTQTTIRGSNVIATQSKNDSGELLKSSIEIETGDLNILSSKNTTETKTKNEHGHITVQQTIYGAAGGPSVNGSYDRNQATDKSTTINNSQLNADNIQLTTSNDLNIRGANVRAEEHLEVAVEGDMNLESQQNRSNSRNTGFGISGGVSMGTTSTAKPGAQTLGNVGDTAGVNGGINTSNGMSVTRETVLTSLTSGGTANVNVKGHSQITGALIATTDAAGADLNQLNFDTGSLSTTDLRNIYQNNQTSTGVSTNLAVGDSKANNNPREGQQIAEGANGKTLSAQTSNLTYSNTNENSASKTLATVGHGNITVGGVQLERDGELTDAGKAAGSPLIGVNRNTEETEKVLWDSSQSQTVDATLDHRLVSEEGRKEKMILLIVKSLGKT
jgi:filamentous hemagglutinin